MRSILRSSMLPPWRAARRVCWRQKLSKRSRTAMAQMGLRVLDANVGGYWLRGDLWNPTSQKRDVGHPMVAAWRTISWQTRSMTGSTE